MALSAKEKALIKQELKRREQQKDVVNSIRNDIGLRFTQGFIDDKFAGRLVKKTLSERFPDSEIEVKPSEDGQDVMFSIDGSNFASLDPKSPVDLFGEVAEQTGRFIEPVVDVGVGLATGNPLAAGLTAGGFQAAREQIEKQIDPEATFGGEEVIQPLLAAGGAIATGEVGKRIGKLVEGVVGEKAIQKVRQLGDADKTQARAGQILLEDATRTLEKTTKGADPTKFAKVLQKRVQRFVDIETSKANKLFDNARTLAKRNAMKSNVGNIDLSNTVDLLKTRLSADEGKVASFAKQLNSELTKVGKEIGKTFDGDEIPLNNLTAYEGIKVREFLNDFIKKSGRNPEINIDALVGAKTGLNDVLSQVPGQAGKQYTKGLNVVREMNTRLPEKLQRKILGKGGDFPSQVDPKTPGEFIDMIGGKSLDERELAQIADVSGLKTSLTGQKIAAKNIGRDILERRGQVDIDPNTRLANIPGEALEQAKRFLDSPTLRQAQQEGFSFDDQLFRDVVNADNRVPIAETFNFRNALRGLRSQGAKSPGAILGGKPFQEFTEQLQDAVIKSKVAQGTGASLIDPAFDQIGRNVLPVRAPFIGNQLGQIESALGQLLKDTGVQQAVLKQGQQLPQSVTRVINPKTGVGAALGLQQGFMGRDR